MTRTFYVDPRQPRTERRAAAERRAASTPAADDGQLVRPAGRRLLPRLPWRPGHGPASAAGAATAAAASKA